MKNSVGPSTISYLITVSRAHLLPAQMLILTLQRKTDAEIVVVGNLEPAEAQSVKAFGVRYIDENDIDYKGRLPKVEWTEKFRSFGWYKQMFIRLSIDTFMKTDQVVILDSEVFVFDNWDEAELYDPRTGNPRSFYWIPEKRKSDWNYQMYRGAAYLLSFLPECKDIMEYADSDNYRRHISGVVLFSTKNVARLWQLLEEKTDLFHNIDELFNRQPDLAFSDHDIYGLAAEYGLFEDTVPTVMFEDLLGWYDNHADKDFLRFKKHAMWSMCQKYFDYNTPAKYYEYMQKTAESLKTKLPAAKRSEPDAELIERKYEPEKGIDYFKKYEKQLDHSVRKRFATMYGALKTLMGYKKRDHVIVEIGTLRDINKGGGHSTYKFGEFCSRYGGKLYTVDILPEAINHSKINTAAFQPWINYIVSDSAKFLASFEEKIDLLYLDGFDSTPGMEKAASKKQLQEIKAAMPHLADKCVILLDDTDLPQGGKAGLSSKFLVDNGFKLTINGYQQVYVRDSEAQPPRRRGIRKLLKLKG